MNCPELKQCLYLWFSDKRGNNIPINESMLIEQAKTFGEYLGIEHNLKYSNDWLENFKFRFHVKRYCTSGESKSVHRIAVVKGLIYLKALICRYDLQNIYNFDERRYFIDYHLTRLWRVVQQVEQRKVKNEFQLVFVLSNRF